MTSPRRYLHLFDDEMVPGENRIPVHGGIGAAEALAHRIYDREAGQYIGTIEITPQLVGPPHVRVIDMQPEAERIERAMRRREVDPYPQHIVWGVPG